MAADLCSFKYNVWEDYCRDCIMVRVTMYVPCRCAGCTVSTPMKYNDKTIMKGRLEAMMVKACKFGKIDTASIHDNFPSYPERFGIEFYCSHIF